MEYVSPYLKKGEKAIYEVPSGRWYDVEVKAM